MILNPDNLESLDLHVRERGKREVEVHVTTGSIEEEVWREASHVAAAPQGIHPWRR